MFDNETIELLKWGGIALGTLGGGTMMKLLYDGTHARIKRVEEIVVKKADSDELLRTRNHVVELFDKVEDVRKDMNGGFEAIRKDMYKAHLDLIERLPEHLPRKQ